MARRRMVTRSFTTSTVKCVVFNNDTNKTGEQSFKIAGTLRNNEIALKAVREQLGDNEKLIPVKVLEIIEESALYGIDEAKFIELAVKLEDRNNKIATE